MKNYIVLDLETPNHCNNSICSIGIVVVKESKVVDKIYTLINPETEFDDFNIKFTGISPEDVVNKPTFEEFWNTHHKLITENPIVGQNITFDLNVISKNLTRYGLSIPIFEYYCTLSSCRRNLRLPENNLNYIVSKVLKTTYKAHNAMDDALVTYKFFDYLKDYEQRNEHVQTYYYRPNCKRDFDRTMDLNYNYLYGLLQKFHYIKGISENHYKLIETWYYSNKYQNYHPLIENVLLKVRYILENKNITEKQMKKIIVSLKPILRSPEYKTPRLKLEILRGIIDSITIENKITGLDKQFLMVWIGTTTIHDQTFKDFKKELNFEDENLKQKLEQYSKTI